LLHEFIIPFLCELSCWAEAALDVLFYSRRDVLIEIVVGMNARFHLLLLMLLLFDLLCFWSYPVSFISSFLSFCFSWSFYFLRFLRFFRTFRFLRSSGRLKNVLNFLLIDYNIVLSCWTYLIKHIFTFMLVS